MGLVLYLALWVIMPTRPSGPVEVDELPPGRLNGGAIEWDGTAAPSSRA